MNITKIENKKNYVDWLMTHNYKYFVTFTFRKNYCLDDCLQQIEFIKDELSKYYFGRKYQEGKLEAMYVNEKHALRDKNSNHIHMLIRDNERFYNDKKVGLEDRIKHLISRVGSQRIYKKSEYGFVNMARKDLQFYEYEKSMNNIEYYNFTDVYYLEGNLNYVMKTLENNLNTDFIHI